MTVMQVRRRIRLQDAGSRHLTEVEARVVCLSKATFFTSQSKARHDEVGVLQKVTNAGRCSIPGLPTEEN